MSKSIKSAAVAAKAAAARRKADIEMVNAVGSQLNQMVSTICEAAVESRRIDFENLESKDRAAVLMSEGTTLAAIVESNNQVVIEGLKAAAPMLAAFLGQALSTMDKRIEKVDAPRAQADLLRSEADERNSLTREVEAQNSKFNAETERQKTDIARMRAEIELEAAWERAASRRKAREQTDTEVNGINANDVW